MYLQKNHNTTYFLFDDKDKTTKNAYSGTLLANRKYILGKLGRLNKINALKDK